jgi:HEAT repeat protein
LANILEQDRAEALPALREALADDHLNVFAVRHIEQLGQETLQGIVSKATEELGDEDPTVRRRAATALAALGPRARSSVPALIESLDDSDGQVRVAAAEALWKIQGTAQLALPKLVELLEGRAAGLDPKSAASARLDAVRLLWRIGEAAEPAIPALIAALQDDWDIVRGESAWVLGYFGARAQDAVPGLTRLLNEPNSHIRSNAAEALRKIDPSSTVPATDN